jgi:crotonobetainyl-CoA:carnitine CoA-transferase CaiB-like acyl-CoA transferase
MAAAPGGSGAAAGALQGVRVVDLTRMLSGPFCTMLLADHGAEVIKIEPFEGDTSRGHGPYRADDPDRLLGGYFQSVNRNKKSLALDLKAEAAKEIVRRLVATADVLVENFRPDVMERLGLGYEALRRINPRLVYAAIRGFGDPRSGRSPYADWPAYDVVAQAMGGLMAITGPDAEHPMKIGPGIGDILPGTMTALGITMALRHAERTGEGQFLDVAMVDAVMALCERAIYQYSFAGVVAAPQGNEHPLFVPFGLFACRDGWVAIACPNDGVWRDVARLIGRPELAQDPRCATKTARAKNRALVNGIVGDWVAARSKSELAEALGGRIPFGPVATSAEIFSEGHAAARGMLAEVEHPGSSRPSVVAGTPIHLERTPGGVRHRAPYLSEHADALLGELGYGSAEIAAMRAAAAIL